MTTRNTALAITLTTIATLVLATGSFAQTPEFLKTRMGTLTGELHVEGRPLANAIISFFNAADGPPPDLGTVRRVPDKVDRTDNTGKFSVELLQGTYYMGALIRDAVKGPGPPRPGEIFFFVRDAKGELQAFAITARQTSQAGILAGIAAKDLRELKNFMTIRGVVKDSAGTPLGGVIVTLNDDVNSARPRFVSGKTSDDGTYEVKVPPGKYYVVAHESIRGGRPTPGSKIGMYGRSAQPGATPSPNTPGGGPGAMLSPSSAAVSGTGNVALPVTGKDGEVIDHIDITMFAMPNPEEIRQKYLDEAEARKKTEPGQGQAPPASQK